MKRWDIILMVIAIPVIAIIREIVKEIAYKGKWDFWND